MLPNQVIRLILTIEAVLFGTTSFAGPLPLIYFATALHSQNESLATVVTLDASPRRSLVALLVLVLILLPCAAWLMSCIFAIRFLRPSLLGACVGATLLGIPVVAMITLGIGLLYPLGQTTAISLDTSIPASFGSVLMGCYFLALGLIAVTLGWSCWSITTRLSQRALGRWLVGLSTALAALGGFYAVFVLGFSSS